MWGYFFVDFDLILNHCRFIMSENRKYIFQVEQEFNDPGQKVTIRKVVVINENDKQKAIQLVQSKYRAGEVVSVDLLGVTDYIEWRLYT